MPYVLRNPHTTEIFACSLINHYDIPYFGVKSWEDEPSAKQEKDAFLREKNAPAPLDWELREVDEHTLKMLNVKLANKASRAVYIDQNGQVIGQAK